MKKNVVWIFVIILVAVGFGGYWGYTRFFKKTAPKYTGPVEEVSLRLKWLHQAQFAGNYVAAEKGFYEDQGLKVDIQPINLDENTIDLVAAGKVDFGISSADDVILARAKGKAIKAIAVIYKVNPVGIISLTESGIKTPSDLVEKKVGIQPGNPTEYLFDATMESKGVALSKIKKVSIGYDASEILEGKVDAIVGYVTNEPDMISQAGKKVSTMLFSDYGVNVYSDVIFTSDKLIETKPELVERFVRASVKGWQYAIEHESEAVDIILIYAKDSSKSHQEFMLKSSIPLINADSARLGVMSLTSWQRMEDILIKQKIQTIDITITDAYTTRFIDSVYEKGL